MYQADLKGQHHELGTSGFLYRSNKLMYDHATKSFWSTLKGEPVVGPLVGKGIRLQRRHVVTTTWGEWKKQHPETTVLSLQTGHKRDYGEGVAYRDYFSTHKLMFEVPQTDERLRNKDEVLALREGDKQLAISATYLRRHPVFHGQIGQQKFVVITDRGGANRVYEAPNVKFTTFDGRSVRDADGNVWVVSEGSLDSKEKAKSLKRLPAHRAFWFGWFSQYPRTQLIK